MAPSQDVYVAALSCNLSIALVDTLPAFMPNRAAGANGAATARLQVVVALQLAKLLRGTAPNTLLIH